MEPNGIARDPDPDSSRRTIQGSSGRTTLFAQPLVTVIT